MQRHKKPNLPIPDPLPDAISCASLDPSHECSIVDDAIEDLATRSDDSGRGSRDRPVTRRRTLACAHFARRSLVLWYVSVRG